MQGWIKCSERMPLEPSEHKMYGYVDCIVTDGLTVGTCDCSCGQLPRPWVSWSHYGDISPNKITHWQPLPEPPQE